MRYECSYCKEEIPKDKYTHNAILLRYQMGIIGLYCDDYCKNRAATLRMAVKNPKKYMPKHLNKIDKEYMQNYVNELHLSINDLRYGD